MFGAVRLAQMRPCLTTASWYDTSRPVPAASFLSSQAPRASRIPKEPSHSTPPPYEHNKHAVAVVPKATCHRPSVLYFTRTSLTPRTTGKSKQSEPAPAKVVPLVASSPQRCCHANAAKLGFQSATNEGAEFVESGRRRDIGENEFFVSCDRCAGRSNVDGAKRALDAIEPSSLLQFQLEGF